MALNWSLDQAKRVALCRPEEEQGPQGCGRCLHGYDPHKHVRLGVLEQIEDAHCRAVHPVMAAMIDFPESLQLVEDGLYTPARWHERGPPRQAHESSRGLAVQGVMVLLSLLCAGLLVRRSSRSRRRRGRPITSS
jgi:hypothetical protein